jgi:integrase
MNTKPVKLTIQGIAKATCPPDQSQKLYPIDGLRATYLRVRGKRKTVLAEYRDASGKQRWFQVCDAATVPPRDIAEAVAVVRGRIAKGEDPAGVRKAEVKRAKARLEPALDAYDSDLKRRGVVKRGEVMSLLRRELVRPLGNVDLATLTRNDLVQHIAAVEASGRPGTAQDLRKNAAVFLGWCADTGRITASPLAGWRRQRRTRAERLQRPGRALADHEIPILWRAANAAGQPFGPYLQMLLLLGQRRTETALMRWEDVGPGEVPPARSRFGAREWRIPAEITKSGRTHRVPLPPAAIELLRNMHGHILLQDYGLVFQGRGGCPISGWSKRLPPIYELTAAAGMAPWTPHDLRRTMRTGLGNLGVDRDVSELLLNHAISDELAAIYDRGDYWQKRVEAATRWAYHVMQLVEAGDKVAPQGRRSFPRCGTELNY